MPVAPPTSGKAASSSIGRGLSSATKGARRSSRPQVARTSQSLRVSNVFQQTSSKVRIRTPIDDMSKSFLAPPRPPDPTLYVRAGTSGVRHLFPIHLTESESNGGQFIRSISRLRSRTPTTELCTNVEMIRNVCSTIRTLQHFDISENELNELPLDMILLIELETLNCSHNYLTDMADSFEQLHLLKELDISYNRLKKLPSVVYKFKHLIRLHCEHNSIGTIEIDLLNLKRLKIFVFDHNQLKSLDTIDFGQMKKLEYFHVANNQLEKFPRGLQHLHHLKNVNLSYNHLSSFPIDLLLVSTLDVLNLNHNLIMKLPPMPVAYKRPTLIFSIDLSFNQLTKFYDYLLLMALKLDLSNNKIRSIPGDLIKKLSNDVITSKELKIDNNPLTQPAVPSEMLHDGNVNKGNTLRIIRNCFDEQQIDVNVRQGFKICVSGNKNSGKSTLVNCLEEYLPIVSDGDSEEKQDRIVHVHEFPFRLITINDRPATPEIPIPPVPISKPTELPKIPLQRFEMDTRKRTNLSNSLTRQSSIIKSAPSAAAPVLQPVPLEPIKVLPMTIFDLSGSPEYYEHMSPFIDTSALHLLCVHTAEFHRDTPAAIEDLFKNTTDSSLPPIVTQLFQILQMLCGKATNTRPIMILPIATCIDLYDKRPKQDRIQALDKINKFFKIYLQQRIERIKHDMELIHSLQTISSSLSDRLKTYATLLNTTIQIESCQSVSSFTFQGIDELHRTIQRCILNQKIFFPNVDRILPTLWAEANQFIESLADLLPSPYILWNQFSDRVISKHGLPHLINDIAMSLHDEGKIMIINEIATTDRVVFLRPAWLTDLLYGLFRQDLQSNILDYEKNELFSLSGLTETRFQLYKKEFLQSGQLHSELIRALWFGYLQEKQSFFHLWLILMRFLLIAYPKMSKIQVKRLVHVESTTTSDDLPFKSNPIFIREKQFKTNLVDDRMDIKFDYAIVPYYLPMILSNEYQDEIRRFNSRTMHIIIVRYTSQTSIPLGFFHRFSVSAILRLNIIYKKHWNNFILGEHEEKDVKFLFETDHRTQMTCHCGTNLNEQSFEEIWNVLMPILNHFEEMLAILAPNNRFDRLVRCPHCNEFGFMGEWTTPKELQCLKMKACPLCGQNVDTARLVQPNESKRRSEELLKRIRERHAKETSKQSDDLLPPISSSSLPGGGGIPAKTQLVVPAI